MALIFATIALVGFAPTYLIPLAANRFEAPALVHIHGLLFFGWTMVLVFQTRLVGRGRDRPPSRARPRWDLARDGDGVHRCHVGRA